MNRATDELSDIQPSCGETDEAHRLPATLTRAAVSEAVLARAAAMLRAAGEPERLRLLDLLAGGEQCVTEIAAATGDAMPTVSQRLQILRREGLLSTRREGKHVFYAVADHHVLDLITNILRHAEESA
jgi:DNA-binding transcriptional ArsR family regulator